MQGYAASEVKVELKLRTKQHIQCANKYSQPTLSVGRHNKLEAKVALILRNEKSTQKYPSITKPLVCSHGFISYNAFNLGLYGQLLF